MDSLWGNASAILLARLPVLQNRILQMIYRLPLLTPTVTLFRDHVRDVLPLRGIHVASVCKFVRFSLNDIVYHTVAFSGQNRIGANRDSLRLGRTQPLSGWGIKRISFQGPTFYNHLPLRLRLLSSSSSFGKNLKEYLLQSELQSLLNFSYL